jgi:hypothetical protein
MMGTSRPTLPETQATQLLALAEILADEKGLAGLRAELKLLTDRRGKLAEREARVEQRAADLVARSQMLDQREIDLTAEHQRRLGAMATDRHKAGVDLKERQELVAAVEKEQTQRKEDFDRWEAALLEREEKLKDKEERLKAALG